MSDAPPPAEQPPPSSDGSPAPPPNGARPAPRPAAARPWQGGRFRGPSGRKPGGRQRAILILSAIMLAVVGAAVAWLFYPRAIPRPYFTAIAVDQYTDRRIPPNQWTSQDRQALSDRGWPESNAFTSQQRDRLVAELRDLGRNQPADQPLVIYLRAYALPLASGKLAVLPGDANLDDENTWLPLEDVFGFIKQCPVHRKLLLLDLAPSFGSARAGAVADDAAARAEPIIKQAVGEDLDLLVLCSCSPGQSSLASEEMGHTVFVHYLLEGLTGAADGWGGGAQDNRVHVRELAAFTSTMVDRWAFHNRGVRQTPVLLGSENLDFALTVDQSGPAPAAPTVIDKTYPKFLKDAWERRDAWQADLHVSTPAAVYRELERDALRAEGLWRGGAKPEEVQPMLEGQVAALDRDARRRRFAGASVRSSLAQVVMEGRKPPAPDAVDKGVFQLRQMAKLLPPDPPPAGPAAPAGPAPPPDPAAAAKLDAAKKAFHQDYDDKPFDAAYLVFQAAKASKRPDDARPGPALRLWTSLMQPEMGKPPDYEEVRTLELLAGLEMTTDKDWKDVAAPVLASAEDAADAHAELDVCPPGPLTDRLREEGRQMDDLRQSAADALANAAPAERANAAKKLNPELDGGRSYGRLAKEAGTLRAALRCREEGLALLPGYAAYLEQDPGREGAWKQAVAQTLQLRDRLANPPADGPPLEWFQATDAQVRSLREILDSLWQPVNSRLAALNQPNPKAGAADAEDMRAMLRLPVLSAKDRAALWEGWRALAGRLNDDALPTELPLLDADKAVKDSRDRAWLRARVSLTLLQLEGGDGSSAAAALDKAQHAADDKALPGLGRELRTAWKRLDESHGH